MFWTSAEGDQELSRSPLAAGWKVPPQSSAGTLCANGSAVTVSGADLNGVSSLWMNSGVLDVGGSSHGKLSITAGGQVHNTADGVIGGFENGVAGSGEVTVSGPGSRWDSGRLYVGYAGNGTLSITGGGQVQSTGESRLGDLFGTSFSGTGTVTVDGANSQWIHTGVLDVGRGRPGTLTITAGGRVESATTVIGRDPGANGSAVTVSGADLNGVSSTWEIGGRLGVGGDPVSGTNGGTSTLRIQSGGIVSVAQDTVLFADDELRLEGGTFSSTGIRFQGGGTFTWTSGTLHVGVYNGSISVPNGGILAPGNSAGRTTIQGDYEQLAGATLDIEIGGFMQSSEYDNVIVLGDVILDGNLQLTLLNGFVPSAGTFTILQSAGPVTGAFANVANGQRLVTADDLGSFLVHYGAASNFAPMHIVLSNFLAALPGDYNQNGIVDADDYTVWRDHLGQSFQLDNEGPGITPGMVTNEDYNFWKSRFGDSLGSGSGAAATATVPEPTTLVLLMLVATGWCVRRGRAA